MPSSSPTPATARSGRRGIRLVLVAASVGVLLAPAVAWAAGRAFTDVPEGDPAFRSINAVADAGLMSGSQGKFLPDKAVTRRALAQVLHRGLHRVSVDATVDDLTVGAPDPPRIAETNMSIDGFQRGAQGVLLTLDMQVEPTSALTSDCTVTLQATSFPENFDVGTWEFTMYAGQPGQTVSATFLGGQLAGTAYTYEVTADNTCGQTLDVVQGALTAQSAAFQGNGLPFEE